MGGAKRCAQVVNELSAVLGAAYEAFLRTRLDRRRGRRGKAHARSFAVILDMAIEMAVELDATHGLQVAVADLSQQRGDVERDVLVEHAPLDIAHEWAAFLSHLPLEFASRDTHCERPVG